MCVEFYFHLEEAVASNGCDPKRGMVRVRLLTFSQNFSEEEHTRREKIAVRDMMKKSWESLDVKQDSRGLGMAPEQPETVGPGGGFQAFNRPSL